MQKPTVSFSQFSTIDLRIGKVTHAEAVAESRKLIQLTVDLGEEIGTKTVFTGMQKWYTPQDFEGNHYIFIVNLEPKTMMGKECSCMMLSADQNGTPILTNVSKDIPTGLKVW